MYTIGILKNGFWLVEATLLKSVTNTKNINITCYKYTDYESCKAGSQPIDYFRFSDIIEMEDFEGFDINEKIHDLVLLQPEFEAGEKVNSEFNGWQEPNWNNRVKLTFEQETKVAYAYPEWINSLKTAPENPRYQIQTGEIIYLSYQSEMSIEVRQMLESFEGVIVEDKPE